MKKRYEVASMATALALVAGLSAPAAFVWSASFSTAVRCDGATIKNAKRFHHFKEPSWKENRVHIDQTGATPASSARVFLRSSQGNDTGTQVVSTWRSVTWDPVLYDHYYIMAYRSAAANCNGALPGHGNYTWDATVRWVQPS
jgi:hypothetical protein